MAPGVSLAVALWMGAGPNRPTSALREFTPGIRLDWERHLVELDATVVLRKGLLELVACSPRTREHESILVVAGRPQDIYQAMGLLGMEPGTPVRYDEAHDRLLPARGQALEISVRYTKGGRKRTEPIEHWLLLHSTRRPPDKIDWVFAGSRILRNGSFAADLEGTVICVVDFDSALIAPASLHTSDNESLWLSANTKAIPPQGTKCTLVIRPRAAAAGMVIQVTAQGEMRYHGQTVTARDVANMVRRQVMEGRVEDVVLVPPGGGRDPVVDSIILSLTKQGVARKRIRVRRPSKGPQTPPAPSRPNPDG